MRSAYPVSLYPSEGGYAIRFKSRDGRRVIVKLPSKTEEDALNEAINLLAEAMKALRLGKAHQSYS